MARTLTTNGQIDRYIADVTTAAIHHAPGVADVIEPLSREVRAKLRLGIDKISVYERDGQLARTCWVTLAGVRHAFTYNYKTYKIDLKRGSLQGAVIQSFDNATTVTTIRRVIAKW